MGDEAFRPLVVMPAYNEEEALGGVLAEVFDRLPGWGVVVVSDSSVDRTAQVAKQAGAVVLNLPINLGVGGALRAGFQYAGYGYTHASNSTPTVSTTPARCRSSMRPCAARGPDW